MTDTYTADAQARFRVVQSQLLEEFQLLIVTLVDTQTGVHYVTSRSLNLSAMTPLLDEDGRVVIDRRSQP